MNLKKGIYEHYKGKLYEVLGTVHHSETVEELVLYKALYRTQFGRNSLWVRPKKMFVETILFDGKKVPRFRYLRRSK